MLLTQRWAVADLAPFGVPRPDRGPFSRNAAEGNNPVLDRGFVAAVRAGLVTCVPAVTGSDGTFGTDGTYVALADGTRLAPDTVIAATGYRPHLEELVRGLDVLDAAGQLRCQGPRTAPGAPYLFYAGFTDPLSGALYQAGVEAHGIARAVVARGRRVPGQRGAGEGAGSRQRTQM
ncbi:hypothetical protein AB0A77_24675 [Streptomyces varsoviensis]|uniref:hypothetical protein n=1 Tax=Streptomyces varsoviensis TaxID=67373 RepID=UPI0033CFA8D3